MIKHHPTCTPHYPEKEAGEAPQEMIRIELGDQTVYQCSDCGAFDVEDSLQATFTKRENVTQRILEHLRTDKKNSAIVILSAFMSIKELEEIAQFWDDRLSPDEKAAIAAAPTQT